MVFRSLLTTSGAERRAEEEATAQGKVQDEISKVQDEINSGTGKLQS